MQIAGNKNMFYFVIKKNENEEYYWELRNEKYHIIGISSKLYKDFTYCRCKIKAIMEEAEFADISNDFNKLL